MPGLSTRGTGAETIAVAIYVERTLHAFVDHAVAVVIDRVADLRGGRHCVAAGDFEAAIDAVLNALAAGADGLGPAGACLLGSAAAFGLGDAGTAIANEALSAIRVNRALRRRRNGRGTRDRKRKDDEEQRGDAD